MNRRKVVGRLSCLAVGVFLAGALVGAAQAQTVLVDFGNNGSFRGVSVTNPDVKGHYWNSLQPGPFYPNLLDINGNPTTVALGYDTPVGTDSYNGPAGATSFPNPTPTEIANTDIDTVALGDLGIKEAAIDFAASPGDDSATTGNNTRFQIQGLDPAKKYKLSLFGSHKFNFEPTTVYTIFTDSSYTTPVASASLNVYAPGSPNLSNRDQVATISGISPQLNNILYVQFVGATGHYGYLNSFELSPVPEPSTLLLLMCGGAALAYGVRRRK
jgi:hypothetical protein